MSVRVAALVVATVAAAAPLRAEVPGPASRPVPASQPASAPTTAPASQPTAPADPYAGMDHTGTPKLPARGDQLPPSSAGPGARRPVPRYDGRPDEVASAGEVLAWIPRVALFPVHAVLEYGVRWPIVKGITLAEKHHLFARTKELFTFKDGKAGVFPTIFYDFGLTPSLGLYFFSSDMGRSSNNLVLQAGFWPTGGWLHLSGHDSFKVFRNDAGTVTLRSDLIYRPDRVFAGLGHDSLANERFFRLRQTEVEANLRASLGDLNRASLGLVYRNARITNGQDPGVADATSPFASDLQREVPGFGQTHNLLAFQARLELDTRSPERIFTPGSGLRLELGTSAHFDPSDPSLSFLRYGGEAAGFLDLTHHNHVLALRFHVELLEPLGEDAVPITERIAMGGPERMRGFLAGWLRGDSAMETTLDYRYPIHMMVDANLFVSLGNTFNGRFEQLHAKRLRMCWGFGLRTNTSREVSFDFMVAAGTNMLERWSDDFEVDHVRVLVGINQGF